MQIADTDLRHDLRPGQLWKVEHGYVYIVELGKRLIHYKMLRHPELRTALTQMIRIEALVNYLRQTDAQLVIDVHPAPAAAALATAALAA